MLSHTYYILLVFFNFCVGRGKKKTKKKKRNTIIYRILLIFIIKEYTKKKRRKKGRKYWCISIFQFFQIFFLLVMVGPRVYSFYSCTSSSENLSRLGSGTATVPEIAELGFSERVSQLIQAAAAAASRTPLGLGGEAGRRCSRFDMTLGSVEGHESNKYSCISWWQLLTVSCFKKYYQIIIMNRVLCFEINDFFFVTITLSTLW